MTEKVPSKKEPTETSIKWRRRHIDDVSTETSPLGEEKGLKDTTMFASFGNEFVKLNEYLSISKVNELYVWRSGLFELRLRNPSQDVINAFYRLKSDLHGVDVKTDKLYEFRSRFVIPYSLTPSFIRNNHEEWIDTLFGNDLLSLTGATIHRSLTAQHDGSVKLKLKTRVENKSILDAYLRTIDFKLMQDVSDPNIIDLNLIRDHGSYDKDGTAYFDEEFLKLLHLSHAEKQ